MYVYFFDLNQYFLFCELQTQVFLSPFCELHTLLENDKDGATTNT